MDITRKVPQPGQGSRPGEEPADEQQQSSADEPRAPIPGHGPTSTLCTSDAIVVASRPSVLTLARRAWAACPVPSVHDLTRRVVDRPSPTPSDMHPLDVNGRTTIGIPKAAARAEPPRTGTWRASTRSA